jgi:hypothetical protein
MSIGGWLNKIYCKIWYWVEAPFQPIKRLRRPFTYIMRDFRAEHRLIFWLIAAGCFFGAFKLFSWNFYAGYFVSALLYMILAHLFWGSEYIPGQQEEPEYVEEEGEAPAKAEPVVKVVSGTAIGLELCRALGIDPKPVRRICLDCQIGKEAVVKTESFAMLDDKRLDVLKQKCSGYKVVEGETE